MTYSNFITSAIIFEKDTFVKSQLITMLKGTIALIIIIGILWLVYRKKKENKEKDEKYENDGTTRDA